MKDFKTEIKQQIKQSINIKNEIIKTQIETINQISNIIIDAYNQNKKVLWMGNGGSAADSQHLACELVSKFKIDRKPLKSIALTTNTSILTAVSNDYDFNTVFERQVDAIAESKDVLIGITTSGTSPNIISAFKKGKEKGTINIAFIGEKYKEIKKVTDYYIKIPADDTPRIQECHILIGHIICDLVEKTIFGEK